MGQRSFSLLTHLYRSTRQFAILGLGRFGQAVCKTLHEMGCDVLAIDRDKKIVSQVLLQKIATNAIQLDSTEPNALKEAGILEFDTVIVAIGNYIQESIITTLYIKESGVKYVVAKASSEIHGKLLKRVGADLVVFPEYDAGCELAYALTKPSIIDRLELDQDHSIVDVRVPQEFAGKTLSELAIRQRFGLNVLAIRNGEEFSINPNPLERLSLGQEMVVIGANDDIQRLPL